MKTALFIIMMVAVVTVILLETTGLNNLALKLFMVFAAAFLGVCSMVQADVIYSNKGKPALPKEVLKVGSMIKIADDNFYVVFGDEAMYILPVFILDLKEKIDPKDPTYIRFNLRQVHGDNGQPLRMRVGYNYIWNGDRLIPATQ